VPQSLNTSVNAFWIGRHLGEAALSAAVHANNLLFVLIALVFGISQASNLLVAQAVGAGRWAWRAASRAPAPACFWALPC
jgi:Na+-driven multidrug efflux pump